MNMSINRAYPQQLTVCYFGFYDPNFSRNAVYLAGLKKQGFKILQCHSNKRFGLNFIDLFTKHRALKNDYDVMILGFPGHSLVPLAQLISRKPVILDALCSQFEAAYISRKMFPRWHPFIVWKYFVDWLAFKLSDLILVESAQQKAFLMKQFSVEESKVEVLPTGVDERHFYPVEAEKRDIFSVLFRGKFLPEAGIKYILEAAKLLANQPIEFVIIGNGYEKKLVEVWLEKHRLPNIRWIKSQVPYHILRQEISQADIMLGQFGNNERLERTIPHKAYEAMAMKKAYLTGNTSANKEIFIHRQSAYLIPLADSQTLADAIMFLLENDELRNSMAQEAQHQYEANYSVEKLGEKLIQVIKHVQ